MLSHLAEAMTMRYAFTASFALALAACGGDEAPPEEGHHPHSAVLFIAGNEVTNALVLPAGETVRIEIRFFDDGGDEITGIEAEHFAALTFDPTTLATTQDVDGQHFQKDVTAQGDIGAGNYTVGYGHDEAADEESFGPFPVTVAATGS
jgi:hypothetical protein